MRLVNLVVRVPNPVFLVLILLGVNAFAEDDLRSTIDGLKSSAREKRFDAIRAVEKLDSVPKALVSPLVSFIHIEAEGALLPEPLDKDKLKPILKVPFTKEEVSLARIKADPEKYIGANFILCGAIDGDNYYNFGYSDSAKTHYSFRFHEVSEDMKVSPSEAQVYVPRYIGPVLSEVVTSTHEKGGMTLVRLLCTIPKERVSGDEEHSLSMIEASEWQFVDREKNEWRPWTFEGVRLGFQQLRRAGVPSVEPLVGIAVRDQEYQNVIIDTLLRIGAIEALSRIEGSKDQVAALLRATPKKERSDIASEWAEKLAESLGVAVEPVAKPTAKREIEPEARASTMLRSAENLEKAKKAEGALRFYREIVAKYPDTKAASRAKDRMKAIEAKK